MSKEAHPQFKQPQIKYRADKPVLLDCPKCHNFISTKDINLEQAEATCSHCQHKFSFEEQMRQDPYRRPEMIMPKSTEVLKLHSVLDIVVDWYHAAPKKRIVGLLGSAFFWNVFLIPAVLFLVFSGDFFFMLLFIGHILTGFSLIWYLLAFLVNKTHIEVTQKGIRIKHKPLPTPTNKSIFIPTEEIKQLYVTRYTEKIGRKSKPVQAYALSAVLKNNRVLPILKGMDKSTQLYLEQEIETYLGIKDKPIEGELPRH